ncbi:MAG: lipid-A-disaccharide synthase [Candidatus Omnitrophica bacterium]|nr:lipid-A-disaccharide synthase [Candidatus Omnitrophota bacterium]
MPSILFVAGDPSGDAHAASLIRSLRAKEPGLRFFALGGPAMAQAGAQLLDHLTAASAIGPFDAARHIGRFSKSLRTLKAHLQTQRPDLVILVDFGDFNLPFVAPLVKKFKIPILYYISPQLWAWGRWRLRLVQRYVDRMVVFFPFEEQLYRKANVAVSWVGHPLIDSAHPSESRETILKKLNLNPSRMNVGLLAGSRDKEISRHLPLMLKAAERAAWRMPGLQFIILRAASASEEPFQRALSRSPIEARVVSGQAADILQLLDAAVVASGTVTLETALQEVPMVVVYRASWPTYWAARAVLRLPDIALVNVVANRRVVPELIQSQANPRRIAETLIQLLRDEKQRSIMKENLRQVRLALGSPGAVERAAAVVLETMRG